MIHFICGWYICICWSIRFKIVNLQLVFPHTVQVFCCFSNAFPSSEWVNLAFLVVCYCGGNLFSSMRYWYFSALPEYNAGIFAVALLMLYCNLSSLSRPQTLARRVLWIMVCPSVFLSVHLFFWLAFWIGSLVFSETRHGVRGPSVVVCDRAGF